MRLALALAALVVAAAPCAPSTAIAQKAGGPSVPAAPTNNAMGRPISRATPSVTVRAAKSGAAPATADTKALSKAKAIERAEKRKVDRDMDICKGC